MNEIMKKENLIGFDYEKRNRHVKSEKNLSLKDLIPENIMAFIENKEIIEIKEYIVE